MDKLRDTIFDATQVRQLQSGGRYACCCLLLAWTLAVSSFVTSTVWLRVCSMLLVSRRLRSAVSCQVVEVTSVEKSTLTVTQCGS